MGHVIKIHNQVLDEIPSLPAIYKFEAYLILKSVLANGHASLAPYEIKYSYGGRFYIFVNRDPFDNDYRNCVIFNGAVHDGVCRIDGLTNIKDFEAAMYPVKVNQLLGLTTSIDAENVVEDDYTTLAEDWIAELGSDPFVIKSYNELGVRFPSKTGMSLPAEARHRFHTSLDDIKRYVHHRKETNSQRTFMPDFMPVEVKRESFDQEYKDQNEDFNLEAYLEKINAKSTGLQIINWLNEVDEYSGVQRELISAMANYIMRSFPQLELTVIDIVLRDKEGNTPYIEEFQNAYKRANNLVGMPRPFTTILSNPNSCQLKQIFDVDEKRLNVDLFRGCRGFNTDNSWERNRAIDDVYQKNLKGFIYELHRMAGLASDIAKIFTKNFRGMEESYKDWLLFHLEEENLVIRLYGDSEELRKMAVQVCASLALEGYPNVIAVQLDADDRDNVVEVHDNSDLYTSYPDLLEEDFLRMCLLIGQTVMRDHPNHKLHTARETFAHPFKTRLKTPLVAG